MQPDQTHDAAIAAGATVLGEPGTTQHYLMTAEQLARMVELLRTPVPVTIIPPPPY